MEFSLFNINSTCHSGLDPESSKEAKNIRLDSRLRVNGKIL